MEKRKRGQVAGVCGEIEILRKWGKNQVVCGKIQSRTDEHTNGRVLKLDFFGSYERKNDVRELYFHILKFFEERKEYKIGWKGRYSK